MSKHAFLVNGAGCGLGDVIYGNVPFHAPALARYHSRATGDGGLSPGRLVFLADLLRFSGRTVEEFLADATGGREPDVFNVGGPALVALTLISQLLAPERVPVAWFGASGGDPIDVRIRSILARTPLRLGQFLHLPGRTPSTFVLSDPSLHGGQGERTFVNDLGVCAGLPADFLPPFFFRATINLYGGTALVPALHDHLTALLERGRKEGAINVVGTVFDFRAEKSGAGAPWGLGDGGKTTSLAFTDLLVADLEEILRITGETSLEAAVARAFDLGLLSLVVTRGPEPVFYESRGGIFGNCEGAVPPSSFISACVKDRASHPGDTTGAGDNFLGGLVSALMRQAIRQPDLGGGPFLDREALEANPLDLREAIGFAVGAGGLACLQYGGTAIEAKKGEKLQRIEDLLRGT